MAGQAYKHLQAKAFSCSKQVALVTGLLIFGIIANTFGQSSAPASNNVEVTALVKKLQHEASRYNPLIWNSNGQLVSVTVYPTNSTDANIDLLAQIPSIRRIFIQGGYRSLTGHGFETLSRFTNLTSVNLACMGKLSPGNFEKICRLQGLHSLYLINAYPPREEYTNLLALTNLEEFTNVYSTNFGPQEVKLLTNLTKLRSLKLQLSNCSAQDTNVLSSLKYLTNLKVGIWPP